MPHNFTAGTASTIPSVDVVSVIRIVAAELKLELQRACVGNVEGVVREVGLRCRQQIAGQRSACN